jgi:hypothetical protein
MTDQPKHTAGPWSVADYKTVNTGNHVIRSPERGPGDSHPVVASVHKRPGYKANAHLIAAAPDLLAACRGLVAALRESSSDRGLIAQHGDALDEGLKAIAKATGQPQPLRDDERAEVLKSASSA